MNTLKCQMKRGQEVMSEQALGPESSAVAIWRTDVQNDSFTSLKHQSFYSLILLSIVAECGDKMGKIVRGRQ